MFRRRCCCNAYKSDFSDRMCARSFRNRFTLTLDDEGALSAVAYDTPRRSRPTEVCPVRNARAPQSFPRSRRSRLSDYPLGRRRLRNSRSSLFTFFYFFFVYLFFSSFSPPPERAPLDVVQALWFITRRNIIAIKTDSEKLFCRVWRLLLLQLQRAPYTVHPRRVMLTVRSSLQFKSSLLLLSFLLLLLLLILLSLLLLSILLLLLLLIITNVFLMPPLGTFTMS